MLQPECSNYDVYHEIAGVVELVLSGSNVRILAYGQAGSGKTYMMDGSPDDPGVNLRALQHLFNITEGNSQTVQVQMSALEICNDSIYDLLGGPTGQHRRSQKQENRTNEEKLYIRDLPTSPNNVHVPGLAKVNITCVKDVEQAIKKAKRRRSTNETSMTA